MTTTIRKASELDVVPVCEEMRFRNTRITFHKRLKIVFWEMAPRSVPCFSPELLREALLFQDKIIEDGGNITVAGKTEIVRYLVLTSSFPNVFNWGGDLRLFRRIISGHDKGKAKARLEAYAELCIKVIARHIARYDLPIVTISLLEGDALGGGLECALASAIVFAEDGVSMGFPEIALNLFPGMGAQHLLLRRVSEKVALELMTDPRGRKSGELAKLGLVDFLVEKRGEGRNALLAFIERIDPYRHGFLGTLRARELTRTITHQDLKEVCDEWVTHALALSRSDLLHMRMIIRKQAAFMNSVRDTTGKY